ncbi:uncharacterized protein LOC114807955 isoform X3 [Ornithorhynchus anatinus]|uniref:uncharacterized protein LOC114807955 isoform X3 n=1 Tax=Ornithorhynchus anatinus TaxID=9258 RepID=UPI0010A91278|nr:uncharacterized protein LOC114807955 isoform X3 [Ornithorhynchus anatinus]
MYELHAIGVGSSPTIHVEGLETAEIRLLCRLLFLPGQFLSARSGCEWSPKCNISSQYRCMPLDHVQEKRPFQPVELMAIIYHPQGPTYNFLNHFDPFETFLLSFPAPALILSNFNIHVDVPNDLPASRFLSPLNSSNHQLHLYSPTLQFEQPLDLIISSHCTVSNLINSKNPNLLRPHLLHLPSLSAQI